MNQNNNDNKKYNEINTTFPVEFPADDKDLKDERIAEVVKNVIDPPEKNENPKQ